MALLARERIHPYHAQVEFSDPVTPDYPDWGTGEAAVVATPSCVAVGTRPDHLGDVYVEVWLGPPEDEGLMGEPKWTGLVRLAGDQAVMGNTVGGHLVPVPLAHGDYQVRVLTSPPSGSAERVVFSLQPVAPQQPEIRTVERSAPSSSDGGKQRRPRLARRAIESTVTSRASASSRGRDRITSRRSAGQDLPWRMSACGVAVLAPDGIPGHLECSETWVKADGRWEAGP